MMIYIIALTSGVKDESFYITLFSINIAMIYMGQIVEEYIRDGKNWRIPMTLGFLLLLSEFGVIMKIFWTRLSEVNSFLDKNSDNPNIDNQKIPSWIKYMIIILFLLYSCFGFISLWSAISGVKYEYVEKVYIILSFIAKATLGIFLSYGLGQRQKNIKNTKKLTTFI